MLKHKLINFDQLQVKFDAEKDGFFSGYASVFDGVDAYGDTIIQGAYTKTLQKRERPIQMRWNHYGDVIGKWTHIKEDEKGLYVEGELTPGHSKASDVYASLKHGSISGLSIGYRVVKGIPNANDGFDLHEIDLVEISVVESPADNAAHVSDVKSEIDGIDSLKSIERYMRETYTVSKADAVALVSRIKTLCRSDSGAEENRSDSEDQNLASKEIAAYIAAITSRSF